MNKVGFLYTATISQVCQPDEMLQFFQTLKVIKKSKKVNLEILSQRLYKKYLTFDQLDKTKEELQLVQKLISRQKIEQNICDSLNKAIESSQYFMENGEDYDPIRIAITEMPASFDDEFRDLSEYDNLQGPPFWLREYLQEYPDTVLPFE